MLDILAQASSAEDILLDRGILGVVVVGLSAVGWKMFSILLKDRDRAVRDRDTLLEDMFTKVLPAISRNTEVLEKRQDLDREIVEALKDSTDVITSNSEACDHVRRVLSQGSPPGYGGV